jgi:hypothetical protein
MFTQPSRLTFWRIILGIIPPTALLALWQLWILAEKLGTTPLASKSWLAILGILALTAVLSLILLTLTWFSHRETLLNGLEAGSKITGLFRWLGIPALFLALTGSSFILFHSYYGDLLRGQDWVRLFIFLLLALLGMNALKMLWPALSWQAAFLVTILLQTVVYRISLYLPEISAYPFAMGWSETSRFYWPSLFISPIIYGQRFPWPILHPSLHLALVPPYLLDAPLWFHRFWQVAIRFLLVGLIAPALISRLKIENRAIRWLFATWIFVYLFTFSLYLHLAVPVFILLWGFSATNDRRTWLALIAASIWAGLSRLNWYPVPGMLAAVLFLLEMPIDAKSSNVERRTSTIYDLRSIVKPLLWFTTGTAIAFIIQRLYIALSGIQNAGDFYTSLSSTLLWNRLWPSPSYPLGIVLGVVIFSFPLCLVIGFSLWKRRSDWNPLRVCLIALALLALFGGGILVSLKIGGGADLHNMDAYAVLLMIICAYLFFGRYTPENSQMAAPVVFHWGIIALLLLIPAWFIMRSKSSFYAYDPAAAQATLTALQQRVDSVNARGGEMLFITQRHLISMRMLTGVKLIPEYEREELMEMAMANSESYLKTFRADLEKHRFAAIIVDPLSINFVGEGDAMGAENNAWTRFAAKRILCTYQQAEVFPNDHIVVYVPQEGPNQCP